MAGGLAPFTPSEIRDRPSWWTVEKVIECIEGGEHPVMLCVRASQEMDGKVQPKTLRLDIWRWKNSATWGDRYQAALKLHTMRPTKAGKGVVKLSKNWYPKFYAAMRRDEVRGNIPLACEFSDVGVELVYALLDKRNKLFDSEFAEQVRMLEALRYSEIRENFLDKAKTDAKIGALALQSAMPSLHSPIQKVEVEGKIEHDHRLPPEVVAQAQARASALLDGRSRQRAIAADAESKAGDVIDAEVVEVQKVGVRRDRRSRH